MTSEPAAFFALDLGAATTSAALVGHLGGRWRLISHLAWPAGLPVEPVLARLVDRVRAADPGLFAELAGSDELDGAACAERWSRLVARSAPAPRLVILAGARRQRRRLEAAAERAGWRLAGGSADEDDPLQLSRLVLAADTDAVLIGADDPPTGDERRHVAQLAALAAAAARQRPELKVLLAGGAASFAEAFGGSAAGREGPSEAPGSGEAPATTDGGRVAPDASPARALVAPAPDAGQSPGAPLQAALEDFRAAADDSRLGIARSIASLAFVLDRTVEVVEVGLDGGVRCRAEPVGEGHVSVSERHAVVAEAGIAPPDPSNAIVDDVLAWSTVPLDRYRLGDRLRELRLHPWGELDGDGALLRLAAARAAIQRLVAATPDLSARPAPDLIVASGGVWAGCPPPIVALALADLIRRSGASQLAFDEARLLAPLGTIEDEEERRRLLSDLADDILVPLGSLVLPTGLRAGRSAGRLRVHGGESATELDLLAGGVEIVDLPPGQTATAELHFHDTVQLGARGRHFTTQVTGGLGGLLVDLRDVPLHLPERSESRREVLEAWQRALWVELER